MHDAPRGIVAAEGWSRSSTNPRPDPYREGLGVVQVTLPSQSVARHQQRGANLGLAEGFSEVEQR